MKRALCYIFAALLAPAIALGQDLPAKYLTAINESGAGLVRGLTLHAPFVDPASPKALYKGTGVFTFTRVHDATHTATYVHPGTGLVTVADNNQLRVEAQGALIERAARINIALRSEQFDNATVWQDISANLTITANQATAPDGTLTADNVVKTPAAWGTLQQDITVANDSLARAFTICIQKTTGATVFPGITLAYSGGTATTGRVTVDTNTCALTDRAVQPPTAKYTETVAGYCRVTVVHANNGTGNTTASVAFNSAIETGAAPSGTWSVVANGQNFVWGAQLETGGFPSSYLPTTDATMTRNVDSLTFPTSGNVADATGTIFARIILPYADTSGHWRFVTFATNHPALGHHSGNTQYAFDGVNTLTGATWNDVSSHKIGFVWDTTEMKIAMDGGTVYTGALTTPWVGGTATIGQAGTEFFHISDLRIWSRAMTSAEIQAVTR